MASLERSSEWDRKFVGKPWGRRGPSRRCLSKKTLVPVVTMLVRNEEGLAKHKLAPACCICILARWIKACVFMKGVKLAWGGGIELERSNGRKGDQERF